MLLCPLWLTPEAVSGVRHAHVATPSHISCNQGASKLSRWYRGSRQQAHLRVTAQLCTAELCGIRSLIAWAVCCRPCFRGSAVAMAEDVLAMWEAAGSCRCSRCRDSCTLTFCATVETTASATCADAQSAGVLLLWLARHRMLASQRHLGLLLTVQPKGDIA